MPLIGSQDMAAPTKRSKIAHLVTCQFTAFDMVSVADFQGLRNTAMDALTFVSLPYLAASFIPYLTRLSFLWHLSVLEERQ
jgi:hypothetical protein